jgi:hypothetical protein
VSSQVLDTRDLARRAKPGLNTVTVRQGTSVTIAHPLLAESTWSCVREQLVIEWHYAGTVERDAEAS